MSNDSSAPIELPLDDRLCLALYAASRAMTSRYRPILEPLGLTYPQYLVMVLLWEEGVQTVRSIGARLRLESSTLSPLLKRLDGLGLIERRRSSTDERSVNIELSSQGRALEELAVRVPDQICQAAKLASVEQTALVKQLRTLAQNLSADV